MRVAVIAHPRARQDRIELLEDGSLAVWVRARPIDGEANAAIERTLARALGLRSWQVVVVAGETARRKTVSIDALSDNEVGERLRTATRSRSFQDPGTANGRPAT